MNHYDLKDRVAIVTGSAQGIGLAVAKRLIASGALVSLWDRDRSLVEATAGDLGEQAHAVVLDQTDTAAVKAAADEVAERFGRIDVLVANAGIAGPNATVADYPVDEWKRVVDINLNGVFNCCRAAARRRAVVPSR